MHVYSMCEGGGVDKKMFHLSTMSSGKDFPNREDSAISP